MEAEELEDESVCIYGILNTRTYNATRTSFITRTIRSLKPFVYTYIQTPEYPPLSRDFLGREMRYLLNLNLQGWTFAPKKWHHWRNRVLRRHQGTWRRARIYEAIDSSLYHAPQRPDFVLELVKYWCPSSNTFAFPWGEVTITLEDVWVLGGYSVLGDPVSLPLKTESNETLDRMLDFQIDMFDRDPKNEKPEQVNWMDYFLDDQIEKKEDHDEELEHVAFLSTWLSRFVFPYNDPDTAINRDVFEIAVHLSEGTRLALAPAVLAGVYHYLSLLKEKAFLPFHPATELLELHHTDPEKIAGPFELIHHWALERFPVLGPPPRLLKTGQPRAARWHSRDLGHNYTDVCNYLKTVHINTFYWRPYAFDILNWSSHYHDHEQVVAGDGSDSGSEQDLTFGLCLCACELEGVAGVSNQKYLPYRVAMQFGMDQHFPGNFSVMKPNRINKLSFFVPARNYIPTGTMWYYSWWRYSWNDFLFEDSYRAATMGVQNLEIPE